MSRKKKQEEAAPGAPAWMATFSDLMNLLLCFFVLLFSMSSVDAAKYDQVVASLNSSFSIFTNGGAAIDEGILISNGVSQLNELDDYYSNMGAAAKEQEDAEDMDVVEQYKKELEESTKAMYEELDDLTEKFNLEDYISMSLDDDFNYVQISLSGAILFDSGSADIKEDAAAIISKVGDLLKLYKDYNIKIEGHTDNVPQMGEGIYKNNLWLSSARACTVYEYLIKNKGMDQTKLEVSGKGEYSPIASNTTAEGRSKNRRVEIKIYNNLVTN